jgi:hypothetical protein
VANQHLLNQALLKGQGLILLKGGVNPGLTLKVKNIHSLVGPFFQGETIRRALHKGWEK